MFIYKITKTQAAKELGLCISSIARICRGERSKTKGFKFKYLKDRIS